MKPEIRNPKSERNPKPELRRPSVRAFGIVPDHAASRAGFRMADFVRASDFRFRVLLWLPLLLLFAACTLEPKYRRPSVAISPAWPQAPGHAASTNNLAKFPAADIGWHEFFHDPRLLRLIGLALTNNPDLRVAALNVEQARALYRVQRDALVPTASVDATGTRQRIPNIFFGGGRAFTYGEYTLSVGVASYELDLFGRVRSLAKQALATYLATEEARKSAQIALVAQVAAAYLTEREQGDLRDLALQSLSAARQAYDLTKRSYEVGVLSQLDLNTADTRRQNARAALAGYEQQLAQAHDNLVLLVGRPLPEDLPPPQPFNPQICLSDIPAGLPSDLLLRRPDVRQAEDQLKAANANIGAARAAFFPTISLSGSSGTASTTLQGLFAPGSQTWAISPQIVWPIFAAGTVYSELQAIKAAQRIEVANYQKAVQTAFREVADALAGQAAIHTQLQANVALANASQQTYQLTKAGLVNGVNSALDVTAARITLDTARQSLVQAQYSRLFTLITLYQVLGGGWEEFTAVPARP